MQLSATGFRVAVNSTWAPVHSPWLSQPDTWVVLGVSVTLGTALSLGILDRALSHSTKV